MKISRSAIVIVIAIALILIAVFAGRETNSVPAGEANQENDALNATIIIAPETADTADLIKPDTAHGNNTPSEAGEIPANQISAEPDAAPAAQGAPSDKTREVAAVSPSINITANATTAPEAMDEAPVSAPSGNATAPAADENIAALFNSPLALGGSSSLLSVKSIFDKKAEEVLAALAAESERLKQIALAREAEEKAERDRAEKEKAELAAKEKARKEKEAKERLAREKAEKERQAQQQQPKPQTSVAVAPTTPATAGAAPADVMNKLVAFGNKRVNLINRSIAPNKSEREIVREGETYICRYYFVDPNSLSVEATPAGKGSPFKYVGKVRYRECLYEVRSSSREEALSAEGKIIKQRNMCELIQYKNNKWLE
ncbi:MAG: hypothetical protein IJD04_06135 [Desulfovibrionaceae bacterium]|nr:hypothetical protein [Desulfovibrionaceae bacterium]